LLDERGLDGLLAGGQHQLELGAVGDVGLDVPVRVHRADDGQAHVLDADAVEVELGAPSRVVPGRADAEADPAPYFDVDRVVEEVPAVDLAVVAGNRKREVLGGDVDAARVGLVVVEDDLGAEGQRFAVDDADCRVLFAEEMLRSQFDLPCGELASAGRAGPGADGDLRAAG